MVFDYIIEIVFGYIVGIMIGILISIIVLASIYGIYRLIRYFYRKKKYKNFPILK